MFIIDQSDTYKWAIKITGIDESGKNKVQAFTAIFKRLSQSRLEEIAKTNDIADRDIVREALVGWEEIKTADGEDVPFTQANLERLIDNAGIASILVTEFMASITGAARRKN